MTGTTTQTYATTFAEHITSRVVADLDCYQALYDTPSYKEIYEYEQELIALLTMGYLEFVIYGFKRNGKFVEASRYNALPNGTLEPNQDPGGIRYREGIRGVLSFTSFLDYSLKWYNLSEEEKKSFKQGLLIKRVSGTLPGVENGYWVEDKTYTADGRGVVRQRIKRFG